MKKLPRIVAQTVVIAWVLTIMGVIPAMWIHLALDEGVWDVTFLQTERARATYFASLCVGLGSTAALAVVLMCTRPGPSTPDEDAEDPRDSVIQPRSPWWVRAEAGFFVAIGVTGTIIELSKSESDRVWWVLGLWFVVLVGSLIEFVYARRSG